MYNIDVGAPSQGKYCRHCAYHPVKGTVVINRAVDVNSLEFIGNRIFVGCDRLVRCMVMVEHRSQCLMSIHWYSICSGVFESSRLFCHLHAVPPG